MDLPTMLRFNRLPMPDRNRPGDFGGSIDPPLVRFSPRSGCKFAPRPPPVAYCGQECNVPSTPWSKLLRNASALPIGT